MMMIVILLIKFIYMLRTQRKQNMNILLKTLKELVLDLIRVQDLLLSFQIIYRMSIKIEEYNPDKECKALIIFDDMIADMIRNKTLNPIVTALFIRGIKLNICLVFITHSYFAVPKDVRLNSTHFLL